MTKQEAIKAMQAGEKVTHRHFSNDEWATMDRLGQISLEDGVVCPPAEFWKWRSDATWETDWEIFNEPVKPIFCLRCDAQINGETTVKCDKCGSFKKQ